MRVDRSGSVDGEATSLSLATEDSRLKRSITRQVGIVLVAVALLAVIFLTATAQAVLTIDHLSTEDDKQRAANALSQVAVLDPAAIEAIGESYQLTGLRLTTEAGVGSSEVSIPAGAEGQVIAWTPRRIGTETFTMIAPLRIGAALALLACISFILFRLHQLARYLDRRRAAAHALAIRDPLTGLANRLEFNAQLSELLDKGADGALILLDLNDFKAINDTHGHPVGDALLRDIAHRLTTHVRDGDLVARLGGDEFAIICRSPMAPGQLDSFADALVPLLCAPSIIDGRVTSVGVSIGMARIPHDAPDAESAIRLADAALYKAKLTAGGKLERVGDTLSAQSKSAA